MSGYIQNPSGSGASVSCFPAYGYLTKNCFANGVVVNQGDNIEDINCSICSDYQMLVNMKGSYLCKENSTLKGLWNFTSIPNCIKYGSDFKCEVCASNFFLDVTTANP